MGNDEEMNTKSLVISVVSLYEGAKTRVRVDYELSEEFVVKVGMHQGSVLSTFLFTVVVDVVTEMARVFIDLPNADDLVLMYERMEGFRNKYMKWKEAFEGKILEVKLGKTKVMVNGGKTKDGLSKSNVELCGVCILRAKASSVLCVQHGK